MTNPLDPEVPREVYSDPDLGKVVSAARIEIDDEIRGPARILYLVNHYAPSGIVRFEDHGDHLRVFVNSYLLGLVKDAFLLVLQEEHTDSASTSVSLIAQRFLSERLLTHSENEIGRVLFLESVFDLDETLRATIENVERDQDLRAARDGFIAIASDLLMFHEFGHGAQRDPRFQPFTQVALQALRELEVFNTFTEAEQMWIADETFADAFAVNTVFARYAPEYDAATLKNYVETALTLLFRFLILEQLALDALHNNVDTSVDIGGVERAIGALVCREHAVRQYIAAFGFGSDTVQPKGTPLRKAVLKDASLSAITRTDPMMSGRDPHSRRMASLVSLGFADQRGFEAIVDACRTGTEYPKWL